MFLLPLLVQNASAAIALNWTAPTTNTDGSPLTDLQGFKVYCGSGTPCNFVTTLDVGNVTSYSLSLAAGTYCFAVAAYNTAGFESAYSNIVYKTEGTSSDTTPPSVTAFTIPASAMSLTISGISIAATDNIGVTGYMVTESATAPSATAGGWSATAPTSYTFATAGSKTLYAWAKDAAGNVSASRSASVSIISIITYTIQIPPVDDTFIGLNNNSNSDSPTLNTYTWPNKKVANTILMKFDLSSIPSDAMIRSAALNLYLIDADTNTAYPTYNLSLNRIINRDPDLSRATGFTFDGINSWTPNTSCYNNIPLAQADASTAYDAKAINKTVGFKSWNATQLVSEWLENPSSNYGLMINSDVTKLANTYRTFASSKYSTQAYHPYMAVTYDICGIPKFKIGGDAYDYPSVQAAYDGLYDGEVLDIQSANFNGNLDLQQSKSVTINGGYICDFSSNPGYTVIHGTVAISFGTVTVENLVIQ